MHIPKCWHTSTDFKRNRNSIQIKQKCKYEFQFDLVNVHFESLKIISNFECNFLEKYKKHEINFCLQFAI